ncbi:PA14 domain-containing protein [Coraliomargarita algicola]|uniref:PA14 domain-containing protein n=1 Tax=Coraliomargarita algicola TaxID=3092156 RepID=A0ABZ0RLF2_9BACT|nr:PA14 domain-containing protein [Coraliomargarita sp. J2-16]WPJ95830.1 PA14 domain-containing protein [Coraliomargarita sp. J2-16]
MKVIFISIVLHIVAAFVAGIITVANVVIKEDTRFEEVPAIEEIEIPKEQKVTIVPNPPKAQPMNHLKMRPVTDISVASIDVDLPSMDQSFTVSAALGSTGGGRLNLGAGLGMNINQFPDIIGFGTTKKMAYAWEGTVYLFKPKKINRILDEKEKIGGLKDGRRQSSKIYNHVLNLPTQNFSEGFPGVTDQFEWFAVDFEVKLFWPAKLAGEYEFRLASDDGSVLFIDRELVVNNDGNHAMATETGTFKLDQGLHRFQLVYYQGPATKLGLVLEYREVGSEEWQLFDLKEYIQYQID